jgi:predicted N-acetyltransferase YhbS
MTITTLKAAPHLLASTLDLIETAFKYEKPQSFAVDFAPLVSENNLGNSFIVINENEKVLAHISVCIRRILGIPVAMLGGIAVDEAHRGEGHFNSLIIDLMSEYKSEVAFFMLWSDQEKLYNKYGFHLCGNQIELNQTNGPKEFKRTKLKDLSEQKFQEIQVLYKESFCKIYTSIERTAADWKELIKIHSANLYIREENNKIQEYFFIDKGQDLEGIIFEYGTKHDIKGFIQKISAYGKVWLGENLFEDGEFQFQFFMAPGDTQLFTQLIEWYTANKIKIREINLFKQEIYFYFNDELLSLETDDFLRGVLGPGVFEELGDLKPLFISGLDSI